MCLVSFFYHSNIRVVQVCFSSCSSVGCSSFRIDPSIFRQMSLSLAMLCAFSIVLIPFNLSCFLRVARYVFLVFPLGFLTGLNASFSASIVVDEGLVPVISYSF